MLIFSLLLSGCFRQQNVIYVDTTDLNQLQRVFYVPARSTSSSSRTQLGALRARVLRDTAMSVGAQGGLAWASNQMNFQMEQDRKYLDTIYNFSGMMLSHGVIPPVLVEGDNTLNLADPNTIRVADRNYKIIEQARFATTPPNWREYLWFAFAKPALPDKSLFPRNGLEQCVWRDSVRIGWGKGIEQAYAIFHQNLARLKRDYRGMILYRKLLQARMISPPFVARTELGITGNGSDMRINDQVLRIVELPQLQTNSRHWKAIGVTR
jgi:defect-in-organelle-trafficking protein DotC